MNSRPFALVLALIALSTSRASAEPPYPEGSTSQRFEGMKFQIHVPPESARVEGGLSLLVILQGAGGTETGKAGAGRTFVERGCIICAPKSAGATWAAADLATVRKLTAHLCEAYKVIPARRHAAGFSNGGWNLHGVALDEKLQFRTACWIAAGFRGGGLPRHAKKEMGCLALAGAEDGNRTAAVGTIRVLEKKVKWVDCRLQPDLGHELPTKLWPFYGYFLEVFEGRFEPGYDLSYNWRNDLDEARAEMTKSDIGGFVYLYSKSPDEKERALTKALQHGALMDRTARFFGDQLVAVKLEKEAAATLIEKERIKKFPAIITFKRGGKSASKTLQGKISAGKLASTLRRVARIKRLPK